MQIISFCIFRLDSKYIWGNKNIKLKIYTFNSSNKIIKNIPILYLVLSGKMSFVGCSRISIDKIIPNLIFKPGITGLGQIKSHNKHRNLSLFDQYYMQNQSLLFDLEIIFKSMLKI